VLFRTQSRCLALVLLVATAFLGGCTSLYSSQPDTDAAAAVPAAEVMEPAPPPEPEPRSFTMVAVGDIMLDRTVGKRIEANGAESILEKVRGDLRGADITFANLECPLATEGAHAPSDCIFRAHPRGVDVLLDGGIDVVTLANNHTFDAGTSALMDTLDHLEKAGIGYCGVARERDSAWEPCLVEANGVIVGFVGCTDLSFSHGGWTKVDTELTEFADHLRAAQEKCDLLVVTLHWGNEYQSEPTQRQQKVATAAVEAGADLVIGHHPHTLQGVGEHRGSPILYSAGNFVFDQREGERMESAIFHLAWTEGEGWDIRMVPVWIPISRCGPIYPETSRAQKIIARLATLSSNLGVPVTVEGTEGMATVASEAAVATVPAVVEQPHAARASGG
jgi:poly-gamma-glutamate synthesis protein (capsule biosynthesis protein)